MSFADFPSQAPAVSLLQKSLGAGRLGHAYLFTGGQLGEMERLAATLAKTLNCQNPPRRSASGVPLDSCDACVSCRKIEGFNHPDVAWTRPESKSRIISIEQIRDLIQTINLKPAEGQYKVNIIVAADRLNRQSANAFLKTLEEPPARSIIILLTTNLGQVLETILSRCLRLNLASDAELHLDHAEQGWLESFSAEALSGNKTLMARYRLLGLLMTRLETLKEEIEKALTAQSPLARHPDADAKLQEKWEDELKAAIEAEYRRKRSELILLLQWWMRDIWLQTQQVDEVPLSLPIVQGATGAIAQRLKTTEAAQNLRALERLQGLLNTNVQEALALEVGLLKLTL